MSPSGRRSRRVPRADPLELEETKGWVHHVVDLDGEAEPVATPLDRPLATRSRIGRWGRLGAGLTEDVLNGPRRRLSPKAHFVESPQSSLVARHAAAYNPAGDEIVWEQFDRALPHGAGLTFYLYDVAPTRSIATMRLSAYVAPGATGTVTLTGWYTARSFALTGYAEHTLDLFTTPPTDFIIVLGLEVGEGVSSLTFREMTYRAFPVAQQA